MTAQGTLSVRVSYELIGFLSQYQYVLLPRIVTSSLIVVLNVGIFVYPLVFKC